MKVKDYIRVIGEMRSTVFALSVDKGACESAKARQILLKEIKDIEEEISNMLEIEVDDKEAPYDPKEDDE